MRWHASCNIEKLEKLDVGMKDQKRGELPGGGHQPKRTDGPMEIDLRGRLQLNPWRFVRV